MKTLRDAWAIACMEASLFRRFPTLRLAGEPTPAPGAEKNDLRYVVGVGYSF